MSRRTTTLEGGVRGRQSLRRTARPCGNPFGNRHEEGVMTKYLTVPELAELLNTSERFVRRLVEERRIVFHRFGGLIRFDVADVDAYITAGRVDLPRTRRRAS